MKNKKDKHLKLFDIFKIYCRVAKLLYKIDWQLLIVLLLFSFLTGVIPGITMILMQRLINCLQSNMVSLDKLLLLLCIYIIIDIIGTLLNAFYRYLSKKFSMLVNLKVDMLILEKTEELHLLHFEDSDSYNMIQRAGLSGGSQLYDYFFQVLVIITNVSTLVISMIILIQWMWWVNIIIILITVVNTIFKVKLSKKQYDIVLNRTEKTRKCNYYKYLLTNDIAYKELKLFQLHKYIINKYYELKCIFFKQDVKIAKEYKNLDFIFIIIEQIIDFVILSKAIIDTYRLKIMVGDTITYIRAISNIKSSIGQILGEVVTIYNQTLYIKEFFEYLDLVTGSSNEESNSKIININTIEVKNLSYKYKKSDQYILKNINFKWEKGTNIIIVGRNGSGKTTLLKIILGFYDDYEGEIFINGIELRKINKNSFRERISVVFQDFNKYELTLKENIGFGDLKKIMDNNYIIQAMKDAYINERFFINPELQLGFWFKDGVQLSGGEWTKVAIARALFRNADLYVWDEPNASLDINAEREIWKSINEKVENKISILITHRIENITLLKGDIVVMKQGRIVKTGSHDELINTCDEYISLFKGENILG